MSRPSIFVAILLGCALSPTGTTQVLSLSDLSSRELERLDRDNTVVIMPGGILEEHGPYLPSFSDGFANAWIADRLAEALHESGRTVLMFPMIPLGAGTPEGFGGRGLMSGSYPVRPETLRAVYMDLASALGDDGFRTIFVISAHGAPSHNAALVDAATYFNDIYEGRMVVLTSVLYDAGKPPPRLLSEEEWIEHGLSIHACAIETSEQLFLQPDLVANDFVKAVPHRAETTDELTTLAKAVDWPGYFGSPRLATPEDGERSMDSRAKSAIELALRILDGFDWKPLPTRDTLADKDRAFLALKTNNSARTDGEKRRQDQWLKQRGK